MIEWSEKYSVGNMMIDKQHQQLFDVINELEHLIDDRSAEGNNRFHLVLHRLSEYARFHFETEEHILMQIGYVDIIAHAKEHLEYREKICDVLYETLMGTEDRRKLYEYLVAWWCAHGTQRCHQEHLLRKT